MGVLLKTWWHDDGCWASPYVDWGNGDEPFGDYKHFNDDNQHYIIVNNDGELSLNHTDGTTWRDDDEDENEDYMACACCGDSYHYDDLDENDLCQSCERDYVWAYTRNGNQEYIRYEACKEVDGDYYHIDYISEYDIYECENDGEFYHIDDLVSTSMGYIHHSHAVALDHPDNDGNDYAYEEDVRDLPDGSKCHCDNFEELNEEIQKGLEHEQAIT